MASRDVDITGLDGALRFLDQFPRRVLDAARDGAAEVSADEAARVRARAASAGRQARLAARSVRAQRGKLYAAAGGGVPAAIFYGAEFGGGARPRTRQFPRHRGKLGIWFWPTLNADGARILATLGRAIDPVMDDWED